ncbi:homoserine dehydrogenase [Helicobacter sp. MIT 05-5293]|uniref:homoserine dehydrogenase n=1 Tax=Helicobacter sp. MIT 05-5293 TaxID=1548149 RepID=UPI00051DF0FE|nr:homoserine dehydrogenase [Helicobacter sp. MIT 05-5293]TLD82231.1 homoserine dehydrogenase [Helicobacter sp. MIT 05-5293]
MSQPLVVGIIGLGTVGSAVASLLVRNQGVIKARAGREIVLKKAIVRDVSKAQAKLAELGIALSVSTRIEDLLEDAEIDVVIELMGGIDLAYDIAQKVLRANKAFVTANKAMLAYHRYDIQPLAKDLAIGFEASVCGGIPIIRVLKDGLSANHIVGIRGILNGTSNYILTQMLQHQQSFSDALKDAQALGYAESDPTLDISGGDAGHKLLILASLAYGINALPEEILIEGIEGITPDDMEFANEFGYVIKLLGIAKKTDSCIELRVHPAMISKNAMIAKVDGVMNGISVIGDCVGESMYYGAGAGGEATASSVISDLISFAQGKNSVMLGFKQPIESENTQSFTLKSIDDIYSRYYIRLYAHDKPGVLGQISQILGNHNISIKAFLQKETADKRIAKLLFSTHHNYEREIKDALNELEKLDFVTQKPYKIRIEDELENL